MKLKSRLNVWVLLCAASVSSCGGGGGSGNISQFVSDNNTSSSSSVSSIDGDFHPAVANSAYKASLVDCLIVLNNDLPKRQCKLSELPFIGQKAGIPTKADILAHTVVTHEWMATRFSQLLDKMPQDMFKLFRGVTGVVIGAEIRPSHYNPDTGAIYLDPMGLWLEVMERLTISTKEDFRSGFSNELNFRTAWRYVKYGRDAWNYYDDAHSTGGRPIDDIVMPMSDLLFHELAHANDFMPPDLLLNVNNQLTAANQITLNEASLISTDLKNRAPLNSFMQFSLANVMFRGVKASAGLKLLKAEQVGLDFETDGSNDSYNYSSQFEDVAMLFEEVMMKYHYQTERDVAFTDAPETSDAFCNEYIVRWGVRNRIANPLVQARAKIIVQQLLGITDADKYFADMGSVKNLPLGTDWCRSITVLSSPNIVVSQKTSNQLMPKENLLPHH